MHCPMPMSGVWGVLSEHLLGMPAGVQHSALSVVVAGFFIHLCIVVSICALHHYIYNSASPLISVPSFASSGRVWAHHTWMAY